MPSRTDEVARGADVPLAISGQNLPPDAATDPGYEMPDSETKGYHTGLVRQPAEPVLNRGGEVHFESVADGGSKFERGSLAELKAAHNDAEAGGIEGAVEHVSITPFTDAVGAAPARARQEAARAAATGQSGTGGRSTGETGATVTETPQSEIDGSSREVSPKGRGR